MTTQTTCQHEWSYDENIDRSGWHRDCTRCGVTEFLPPEAEKMAKSQTTTRPNAWERLARQIEAQLIPHTTSVQNVKLIADALEAEYNAGVDDGREMEKYENG